MVLIREYIKYKLNSKGKHDIHSPYVFDFITNCLTIKHDKTSKEILKKLTQNLRKDNTRIDVNDLGAGSKKLNNSRTVNEIFKNSSSKGVYAKLLYQLSKHYKPSTILELGTNIGVGTANLALGNSNSKITTIEGCKETQEIAKSNLKNDIFKNIDFINKSFVEYLKDEQNKRFDLVFIDGHHDGKALLNYMKLLKKITHNDTIFILDDIRWSEDMYEAWENLRNQYENHVTIDLFKMGIIVRRPQQAKEHFTIKLKGVLFSM